MNENPIIVALDVPTIDEERQIIEAVGDAAWGFKVGLQLFSAQGPEAVRMLQDIPVFLDLKLHDIPTTVARAVQAVAPLRVQLLTVHALAGRAVLEAANDAKRDEKVLAVTILTSFDDAACKEVGLPPIAESVPALAELAFASGCDGVVCAPTDAAMVRALFPPPFIIVTPGVRPPGAERDEQARVLSPREAVEAGADKVVIGRPITRAEDPRTATVAILESIR